MLQYIMLRKIMVISLIWVLIIITTLVCPSAQQGVSSKGNLQVAQYKKSQCNTTEPLCSKFIPSEEHTVTTVDGYILTIFRMPKDKACPASNKYPPVLLMHGLLSNSDSWLDTYPEPGLPYLLSNACYDLWLGNVRGNSYGRRHVRLNPDTDSEFWKFYSQEMGMYDLPATIDYILNVTGSGKLNYIGHSQGGRIFYILCSEKPQYRNRIGVSITLAPPVRLKYTRSIPVRLLVKTYAYVEPILTTPYVLEVLPKGSVVQISTALLCKDYAVADSVCRGILAIVDSYDPGSIATSTLQQLFNNVPAGTSARTLAAYGQNLMTEDYRKYSYGASKNVEIYGTPQAPLYNLTQTTVPVVVIYGSNDFLVDTKDIHWLLGQLPNLQEGYLVEDSGWNHFDFVYSKNINKYVFPKINKYLKKYSTN